MSSPGLTSVRRRFVPILMAAVLLSVTLSPGGQGRSTRTTWKEYGGGPDNSRYVELDQINKRTLARLDVAWTYPTGDNLPYNFGPLVVDDTAFVLARNNSLVALDATTGKEIWVHADLQGIAPRGINYWESADRTDRRLLFQRNNYLEAIDAQTGKSILSFGTDGALNLREGFSREVGRVQSSNPGKIFENLIILGSATGEAYLSTPGDIRAYDVVTGKEVWRFHTIPHPGEFGYETWPPDAWKYIGGANTWGELTVDPARGIVFVPTGSPTYDFYGADRIGANLFGTSLVALDARTGKREWHFQTVHHDLWDYDNTAAPVLTTIRRNGKPVDVVAQAGKTGYLYVFNRTNGEPIWPIEERPVGKSDVPGEQAWPTQPFPPNPPPFARQKLTPADVSPYMLTRQEQDDWKKRIDSARNNGLFTPPGLVETISFPGAQGGANWGTTASNPTDGTVYVLSINVPSFYKLDLEPPPPAAAAGRGSAPAAIVQQGQAVYVQRCQSCHMPTLEGNGVNVKSLVGITHPHGTERHPRSRDRWASEHAGVQRHSGSRHDRASGVPRQPERRGPWRRTGTNAGWRRRRRLGRRAREQAGTAGRTHRRRHGGTSVSRRCCSAVRPLLHRLRHDQQPGKAALLDAHGIRPEQGRHQMADSGRRRRARSDCAGWPQHRIHPDPDRNHLHLRRAGVPRRWRRQAARVRCGQRPRAVDRHSSRRVAGYPGNVRGERTAVSARERHAARIRVHPRAGPSRRHAGRGIRRLCRESFWVLKAD